MVAKQSDLDEITGLEQASAISSLNTLFPNVIGGQAVN
jgi:hypothetical protein